MCSERTGNGVRQELFLYVWRSPPRLDPCNRDEPLEANVLCEPAYGAPLHQKLACQ
jgi:hypothetical protein